MEFRCGKIPRNRLGTVSLITLTASTFYSEWFYLPRNGSERNQQSLLLFLFHGTEFRVFSLLVKSLEVNSESLLLFWLHGTEFRAVFSSAEEGIPRACFYFCSTEQNSELFFLPRKGWECNSESFLFHGTAGIPSEMTICSVYSVFRGIIFLSENFQPQQEVGTEERSSQKFLIIFSLFCHELSLFTCL